MHEDTRIVTRTMSVRQLDDILSFRIVISRTGSVRFMVWGRAKIVGRRRKMKKTRQIDLPQQRPAPNYVHMHAVLQRVVSIPYMQLMLFMVTFKTCKSKSSP